MSTRLYLAGTGNVSLNLIKLLSTENKIFSICGMENSRGQIYSESGMNGKDMDEFLRHPEEYKKNLDVKNLDFDLYVDMRTASRNGERERDDYLNMFKGGKHVVTANKSGLANFFPEIMDGSLNNEKKIYFEATVAGGLPIFSLIKGSFPSFKVTRFRGVINLTSNFIMKKVRSGMSLNEARNIALREGVAETDMTDDLDGTDSARKAVIISNALFGQKLRLKEFNYDGIDQENIEKDTMLLADISSEGSFHAESKLFRLGMEDPFFSLDPMGMACEISFKERKPVFISENMDGPLETAGAVLSDLINLSRVL
ncbi:MAG: hypothetical protein ACYCSO_06700 [Cuniculiplasma sp.]